MVPTALARALTVDITAATKPARMMPRNPENPNTSSTKGNA